MIEEREAVRKTMVSGLGVLGLVLAVGPMSTGQTVRPVPKIDMNRFTGTWYEVARYPKGPEKKCTGQPMGVIAKGLKPNTLQFVHTCEIKGGYTMVRNGKLKPADKSGDGKLKLIYTWPFSTKYWVFALEPEYKWALVGSPNHKELRVLSRTAKMKPEVLAEVEGKAAAAGFSPEKLIVQP